MAQSRREHCAIVRLYRALLGCVAVSALAPADARAQTGQALSQVVRSMPIGALVPLSPGLPAEDTIYTLRLHVQMASASSGIGTHFGAIVGGSGFWFAGVHERDQPGRPRSPFISGFALGARVLQPAPVDLKPVSLFVPIDLETGITTTRGARFWSLGARVPVSAALRAGRMELGAFIAPAVAWGHVRFQGCDDRGPDDNCGDLGIQLAFGAARWLIASGLSVRQIDSWRSTRSRCSPSAPRGHTRFFGA